MISEFALRAHISEIALSIRLDFSEKMLDLREKESLDRRLGAQEEEVFDIRQEVGELTRIKREDHVSEIGPAQVVVV